MEGEATSKHSRLDLLMTFGGLVFFLVDIVLDALTVVTFYEEENYVYLGLLLLFLLGSSVLAQVYSWLWYRYAGIMEVSVCSALTMKQYQNDYTVFFTHDLSLLRFIETFSESAPQLVLMLSIILQRGVMDLLTILKVLGSASAIAYSITMYHRSLRSFLRHKHQQSLVSSLVYFVWNLLLIVSRLVALALFASILPCYIFTHFLCSWIILFFFAWRSKTDLMDSPGGEWLFRATVGLIWYFSWFNVSDGDTRTRSIIYHVYVMLDVVLLCGLSYWQIDCEPTHFEQSTLSVVIICSITVLAYGIGILFKVIYYKCYHPKIGKHELKQSVSEGSPAGEDVVDTAVMISLGEKRDLERSYYSAPSVSPQKRENKRMRMLAENFYS
ncbi:XK-related protein 8-like isoform X2 [Lampris incognitus]|uniref:XK-related protein 8-like isoform X2 n=1 Tax=Lampris incognitus TaxID=2546036 RepID=UPI0024B57536|nr:XK-related protein 8-like isoform X2 [Lampris incognitus]